MEYLQDAQNYPNFLSFFQCEIDQKGVDYVLNEYLFQEDERTNEMLLRMFTGKQLTQLVLTPLTPEDN
jgi:hypothetical protein